MGRSSVPDFEEIVIRECVEQYYALAARVTVKFIIDEIMRQSSERLAEMALAREPARKRHAWFRRRQRR